MENKIENKNYTITIKFEDIDFNRVSWFMSDCANEEDPELNLVHNLMRKNRESHQAEGLCF